MKKPSKQSWWTWAYIPAMLPLLYVILTLSMGNTPLFRRVVSEAPRGEVPDVSFLPNPWMWVLVAAVILFLALFFQVLRHWARYYLSRKMLLSYLFFAFIPLVTSILIFVTITKVMLGISSLLTFEDAMDRHAGQMAAYSRELRDEIATRGNALGSQDEVAEIVHAIPRVSDRTDLQILWISDKEPGLGRIMIPYYPKSKSYFQEHKPDFERFWPSWLTEKEWRGIVDVDGNLYIRHFLRSGNWVFYQTTPVDAHFLRALSGFQVVQVTMENSAGTTHISTMNPDVSWWRKLPLLTPFSSRWDSGAFNWQSGLFQQYGGITFGLELSSVGIVLENTGLLPFFYSGQKLSSVKVIIGIILIVMLCVLIALVFGGYLVGYITRSLNLLADGHEQIALRKLDFRLPFIGRDQLGAMGTSFNEMVAAIDNLMAEVATKEKYHEELRIARDIQMSLLPNVEELKWVENIAARCIPARDVGGDYYELVQTEAGEIGIFIADVSGKGTSAAFYMAELKGVLIALRHLWHDPTQLMPTLNEIMRGTLSSNVFISAAYLLLDPVTRRGELARAGHCPAFLVKPGGIVQELSPPGMAIGIAPTHVFSKIMKTITFPLEDDDKILLYTDGLDEMTKEHELYGIERLRRVLEEHTDQDVESLKQTILDDVLGFLSSGEQNDDLTLVVAGLPSRVREPIHVESAE